MLAKKGKAIPVQAKQALRVPEGWGSEFLDSQGCECSEIDVRAAEIIMAKTVWSIGKPSNWRKILRQKDEFCVLAGGRVKRIAEAKN
jgi:hypothetical protein